MLSRQVPGSIPVSIIAYCPTLHSVGSALLFSHLHYKSGAMGFSSEGKLLLFFVFLLLLRGKMSTGEGSLVLF